MLKGDKTAEKWLSDFPKDTTKRTYLNALNNFKKILGIANLGEYLKSNPDATADFKRFLTAYNGKPSKTVATYSGAIKMFFEDHNLKIERADWRKMRRRGFMPKRIRAETKDRKPTPQELKNILKHADIKCRAMVLFLISSGGRIGETLQLKDEDLKLDADPPEMNIRREYTKGGVGGRIAYFSYEARDEIKEWLKVRDTTTKHDGTGTYKSDRVFPWDFGTARFMFNNAVRKAKLESRDTGTNRLVLHLHSLRKFFRSNIGLDIDVTHALMGHTEYLDEAYLRLEQDGEIAKAYKEAMGNVSIFNKEELALRQRTNGLEAENRELKERITKMESEKDDLQNRVSTTENKLSDLESTRATITQSFTEKNAQIIEDLGLLKKQLAELQTALAIIRDVVPSDLLVRLQLKKLHREQKEIPGEQRSKEPMKLRERTERH